MLTEVMRFYRLARPPVDAAFFETEHHTQVSRDIRAAIIGGRLTPHRADRCHRFQEKRSCRDGCGSISNARGG